MTMQNIKQIGDKDLKKTQASVLQTLYYNTQKVNLNLGGQCPIGRSVTRCKPGYRQSPIDQTSPSVFLNIKIKVIIIFPALNSVIMN